MTLHSDLVVANQLPPELILEAHLSFYCSFTHQLSPETIALPLCWPVLEFLLGEFVKHFEARREARDQKRAKLEFGTKLGMHSPL